jgi:glucose-1-phosphatase
MERNFTYLTLNTQFVLHTNGIKNILFDLGGVIINLSVEKTHRAFASLSGRPLEDVQRLVHHGDYFKLYEKGLITDDQFRDHLRQHLQLNVSDKELDQAWNAMLLDIPVERIRLLERLKNRYNLYLLSNTNNIHLQCFNEKVKRISGKASLDTYFLKAFYSHLIKKAKPDLEIYEYVLTDAPMKPEETLFLDDNKDNLAGASRAGIRTYHVQEPDHLFSLFA